MPRINLTSKGLSWAQPLVTPETLYDEPIQEHASEQPETTFTSHGAPVLGPLPESIGAVLDDANASLSAQLLKGPAIVSTNLAESTPIGFSLYVIVLALVFYSLNLWINVLSKAIAYFNENLAMANWNAVTGPQLTLFALVFTLVLKYSVDVIRFYWSDETKSETSTSTSAASAAGSSL